VIKGLPSICKTLGSIPALKKKKRKEPKILFSIKFTLQDTNKRKVFTFHPGLPGLQDEFFSVTEFKELK
jgi:hypothetical protein